jgi:hypothetical protein
MKEAPSTTTHKKTQYPLGFFLAHVDHKDVTTMPKLKIDR